mmetsp:Transcript_30742/g.30232  ORF Transcript_30742/g.30232 Transcript_30742/m.30232 type:complete len:90 (-) Transcript_30742:2089-2358(-)
MHKSLAFGSHPLMSKDVFDSQTSMLVLLEQSRDEVFRLRRDLLPTRKVEDQRLMKGHPDSLLLAIIIEGKGATEQGIENAAQAPEIAAE